MLVTQSIKYLIKSYCRESSFSIKEVAKLAGMKEENLRQWLDPSFLPEASDFLNFTKRVKIPKVIAWEAYFNSVQLWDHNEPTYKLGVYSEKQEMIHFNRKKRKPLKHPSSPWDESYEIFGEMSLNSLTIGDLLGVEENKEEAVTKSVQSKKYKISKERLKSIKKGSIPTIEELDKIINESDYFEKSARLKGFAAQVVKTYKLNLYLSEAHSTAYLNLLDRLVK